MTAIEHHSYDFRRLRRANVFSPEVYDEELVPTAFPVSSQNAIEWRSQLGFGHANWEPKPPRSRPFGMLVGRARHS
jgi:hypothetical protein